MVKSKSGVKRAAAKPALLQAHWFPWILLTLVTSLAYINAWPNTLVFDDKEFLAGGRFTGLDLSDFTGFFTQSLWEASGSLNNLYRPALMVSFGVEYVLFENWNAGFHLVNIFLHIAATLLVFGFMREVMRVMGGERPQPDWPVLLAAMVFSVHPVLTDVVNSVFNGSEIYVAIGTCGGLWYLLRNHRERPFRVWILLSLLYFWALLYRESALALPALAVVTLWFTSKETWPGRLKQCLPVLVLLVPLACYFALRSNAFDGLDELSKPSESVAVVQQAGSSLQSAAIDLPIRFLAAEEESPRRTSTTEGLDSIGVIFRLNRVSDVIPMWFDALKLMVWPHPLLVLREVSNTSWLLALVTQLALLALVGYALFRKQPIYILGFLFFYLAIFPASRIVSDSFLPPLLMDRMLYLPSVGLMLCLAAGLQWLSQRTSPRTSLFIAVVLIGLFIPVTWARNHEWSDEIRLLETDFSVTESNPQLLYSLVSANRKADGLDRSMELCELYPEVVRKAVVTSRECAQSFAGANRFNRAEHYFRISLDRNARDPWTHFEYARLLVEMERRNEARAHFDKALVNEKLPYLREVMSAIMILDMYPYDRKRLQKASEHIDNALQLQPRSREAKQLRQQLDQRL